MIILITILIFLGVGVLSYLIFKVRQEQESEPELEKRAWRKEDKESRKFFFPPED